MWAESARHQSQPSNKQNQHDRGIEETRWPEIDMHVGNNARKNEERARDRKKPSDQAAPTPEKQAHSDQHRQKRDPESIASVKSPVGADHADLIAEKVSSNTSHGETDQEVAEAAGRPAHVAQGPIFHTGRISDASSGVPTSGLVWRGLLYGRRKRDRTIVPIAIDKPEDAMGSTLPNVRKMLTE